MYLNDNNIIFKYNIIILMAISIFKWSRFPFENNEYSVLIDHPNIQEKINQYLFFFQPAEFIQ